eukprot:CAMPEP_0174303856 /NCGR_PEP_ID=MMETSP0809-20121228/60436_1 /TAXON_ID=73025 ORGANISM="Eutreptiella gymnastica-like, Strain CCMP1594" /NCGR_SAMPLE_ID=MMETSP0809 /ASSEMBLY_ACC=CAM_ASM_000658 /LENGTH=210 /DNA_ID=CAMNT_0015409963 /DNA_START=45 /DNA_END=677 /DNA_ORIENTATION=-
MTNPFISKDTYAPPSPGPGAYTPRHPWRTVVSPLLAPTSEPVVSKKDKQKYPDNPGPGTYKPRDDRTVAGPKISEPVEKYLPNPDRVYTGPMKKRTQKGPPPDDSLPGPGAYNPRPVRKSQSGPIFDKLGTEMKGPLSHTMAPKQQVAQKTAQTQPGPTSYNPRPPRGSSGTVAWMPPTFNPAEAKRRYDAYKAAQSRRRRPWKEGCIKD